MTTIGLGIILATLSAILFVALRLVRRGPCKSGPAARGDVGSHSMLSCAPIAGISFGPEAASASHLDVRSRTIRPYMRTISSARTRPCRIVRSRVRI